MGAEAFHVRPGAAADLMSIAAIERQAAPGPWSLSQFVASSLRKSEGSLIVESADGEALGFAVYQRVLDEATLLNIAVLPDYQGRGLGARLLRELLEHLSAAGVARFLLEVRQSNERAIGLYRRFGFVDDGVRRDYYPTASGREDALLMSCQLDENA